jgi:hypothetical protein
MAKFNLNSIPKTVTAQNTADNELVFNDGYPLDGLVAVITVVSGTFKFNNIGPASNSNVSYTDGESLTLTILKGFNISYIAATGADTFKIEI